MFDIIYRPAKSLDHPEARYSGFVTGSTTLPAGSQATKGGLRLPCDIIWDRNIALTMRDGIKIYADFFRPAVSDPIPAIINWAPYGKAGTGYWTLDNGAMFPNRFGIKRSALSGLQSWEGCDPAYWCARGYAVVQIDSRGVFGSEGDVRVHSKGEAEDGSDAVEAIAALAWCSGRIGMAGNSWLAMSQWRIAAERPPHLAAIAPWEGMTDLYRDSMMRGGVPRMGFPEFLSDKVFGNGKVEDVAAMAKLRPLFDDYWADKVPQIERIEIPAYVVASYTNQLHTAGTLRGWEKLRSPSWLRVHNTQEWPDFYNPQYTDDLCRFFDRYLKQYANGWEKTPQVRISVLDPGGQDVVDRPEDHFPPTRVTMRTLFLDGASKTLRDDIPHTDATISYALNSGKPEVELTYRFDVDTEVIGCPLLTLWASVEGHDDMDLHVYVQKLSENGKTLWHQTVDLGLPLGRYWMPKLYNLGVKQLGAAFYGGPDGVLRLSRRGLDPAAPAHRPELLLDKEQRLSPNEIVRAEIPLWPTAMKWRAGEQLRLRISARCLLPDLLPGVTPEPLQPGTRHTIYTGPRYPSTLTLPVAPILANASRKDS